MVVELIGQILLEIVFAGTGHLILWAITLGRWRPLEGREELAMIVGCSGVGRRDVADFKPLMGAG